MHSDFNESCPVSQDRLRHEAVASLRTQLVALREERDTAWREARKCADEIDSLRTRAEKAEGELQRRSFAYGNAGIDNPDMSPELVAIIAERDTTLAQLAEARGELEMLYGERPFQITPTKLDEEMERRFAEQHHYKPARIHLKCAIQAEALKAENERLSGMVVALRGWIRRHQFHDKAGVDEDCAMCKVLKDTAAVATAHDARVRAEAFEECAKLAQSY